MNGDFRVRIRITRAGLARVLLLALLFGLPGLLSSQTDQAHTVTLNMGFPAPVGVFAQLSVNQDVTLLATGGALSGASMFGDVGDLGGGPFSPPTGFIVAGPAVLGQPESILAGGAVAVRFNNAANLVPVNGAVAGAALALTDQVAGKPPWIIQAQTRPGRAPREALWFSTTLGGVPTNAFGVDDQGSLLIGRWVGPGFSCDPTNEFSAFNGVLGSISLDGDLGHYCDENVGCDVSDATTAKLCVPFKVKPPAAGGW